MGWRRMFQKTEQEVVRTQFGLWGTESPATPDILLAIVPCCIERRSVLLIYFAKRSDRHYNIFPIVWLKTASVLKKMYIDW